MIDIEYDLAAEMEAAVQPEVGADFHVYTDRTIRPEKLPAGFLEEIENATYTRTSDSNGIEHHATVTYRWTVTSKKKNDKKSECKRIFSLGDAVLTDLGFVRISKAPTDMNNATMYRLTGRYTAVVDTNKQIIGGKSIGS